MPSLPLQGQTVVVTDGLWRKSLSAIRSLGKAGAEVHVTGDSLFTTGFWSRYTSRRVRATDPARDAAAFEKALLAHLERLDRGAVLLPMEEATIRWLTERAPVVADHARFLIPDEDSLSVALDKGKTFEVASQAGIPAPHTDLPEDPAALARIAADLAPGSFVVKPRAGSGSTGVVYGEERDAAAWREHWDRYGPMVVQERVPAEGRAVGVACLFDSSGTLKARFTHQRLKQYPVGGGPSTDRESIHEPQLEAWSEALLRSLDWRGIAMVEWKQDPVSGGFRLLEINPRFWGSLELAVRAGIDFPTLYALATLGEEVPESFDYADHVRCRWMMPGDILRYLSDKDRESPRRFLKGAIRLAEEWDRRDKRGALATVVCTGALALNPRYWRYLRR
ncbi:MAG: ATP-grasp domain-containing protein [Actinobacteria bacterium]|nr:ATP-grasp domain-containing protein [Actinomycetota bacterium]